MGHGSFSCGRSVWLASVQVDFFYLAHFAPSRCPVGEANARPTGPVSKVDEKVRELLTRVG